MPKKKVTEAVEEVVQEPVVSEPVPPQAPRRQGSDDLLELNDLERGVTREDSEDAKWGYLAGAARRQQILTGIVSSGIIQTENGLPVCPVDFEGLRILIPIREMVLTEWPEEDPIPRSVRIQIGRMLGATIDFIPAAVDIRNRAAVGSRKAAMLQRQKRYYATGRVKPGILMACRVLGVGNNTMTVEACGVDTEIYARNVSWEWFSDIADLHSTGDLVVARVMDVSYNEERDVYSVTLSIKEASENPDRAALEKITPNSNYFGVVTGVKDRVFFVRLQVGVNAKTKVTFKTNLNDYRTLASNLLTSNNYSLSLNAATLRLVQGEYVTDVRFEFGTVPSGFSSVVKPTMRVQVLGTVSNGYQIINRADVGGQYLNEWQTAKTTWVTTVRRFNTTPLPKTGY